MNDADTEAVAALLHNKAVDAASVSVYVSTAIINAINAQPGIDNCKFTEDVIANLRKSASQCTDDQALAKWAMALMASTISNAYEEAIASAKVKA